MRDLLITNGTLIEGTGRTPVGMVWPPGGGWRRLRRRKAGFMIERPLSNS